MDWSNRNGRQKHEIPFLSNDITVLQDCFIDTSSSLAIWPSCPSFQDKDRSSRITTHTQTLTTLSINLYQPTLTDALPIFVLGQVAQLHWWTLQQLPLLLWWLGWSWANFLFQWYQVKPCTTEEVFAWIWWHGETMKLSKSRYCHYLGPCRFSIWIGHTGSDLWCFTLLGRLWVQLEALTNTLWSFICQPLTQCHTGSVIAKLNDLLITCPTSESTA